MLLVITSAIPVSAVHFRKAMPMNNHKLPNKGQRDVELRLVEPAPLSIVSQPLAQQSGQMRMACFQVWRASADGLLFGVFSPQGRKNWKINN